MKSTNWPGIAIAVALGMLFYYAASALLSPAWPSLSDNPLFQVALGIIVGWLTGTAVGKATS